MEDTIDFEKKLEESRFEHGLPPVKSTEEQVNNRDSKEMYMVDLQTLMKNGWWEDGVERIVKLKKMIDDAEKRGEKTLKNIHYITNINAIAYFTSFGMGVHVYHIHPTGTKADLTWK